MGCIIAMSFYEVQKFLTLTRHTISIQYIVTSEKFFKSLPVDLRKVFVKAGREASIALRQAGAGIDDRALKVLTKSGMQVYEPTPAEKNVWVKTLRGPVVAWLKKNVDSELVDELLKASNKGK
jgi:TRAP-type C4-dicarboxylate transport system substrate-binding protein